MPLAHWHGVCYIHILSPDTMNDKAMKADIRDLADDHYRSLVNLIGYFVGL